MEFLVTGGAGFLGINLIRFLLNKGHQVVSLDIAEFEYDDVRDQVEIIQGDIRVREDVIKAMQGCDVVVHSAAALPLYPEKDIYSTNIDGTRLVLEIAKEFEIERFVHISSTAVYGIPDHHPLLEDDNLEGVGPYGITKVEAEKICTEYRKNDMCIPILRPKSFVGPERLGVFALFYDWTKDGKNFPMIGKGDNKYQLLDVEDLCEAIYLASSLEKDIVNDTFNIGAKDYTTMKEDYQAVLDEAGFGKKIIGLPAAPVIMGLKLLEKLNLSPLYKWVYETASKESFVSVEKAEQKLGYKPKHSNKDALVRNYRWYLDNLERFSKKSGVSHRVPWNQGILKIAKKFF